MPTLVALLAAAAAFAAQEPPRATVAPLGDLVQKVFPNQTYTVTYGKGLEDCPVAYRFDHPTTAKGDLIALCKVLYLDCEFDEAKRTITLKRGPRLQGTARTQRMQTALARLTNELRPFLNAEPAKILDASHAFYRQAKAEEQGTPQKEKRQIDLEARTANLRLLLETRGGALLRSLIADPNQTARTFLRPCTLQNQLPLSPDARSLWKGLLEGRDFHAVTYLRPKDREDEEWTIEVEMSAYQRRGAPALGDPPPFPLIRHSETSAYLYAVTPTQSHPLANVAFSEWPTAETPPPIPPELARVPIKRLLPWKDGHFSSSGFSSLADHLKLNYAAWLSTNPTVWREGFTLEEYRRYGLQVETKRADGWLSVSDPFEPLTQTSPGWRVFLRLLPAFEKDAPERLLPQLEALKPKELEALEEMGTTAYFFLPERFRPLTTGIRLYRSALRAHLTGHRTAKASIPYESLPAASREDIREFLRSNFCFTYYPQFFHPANMPNFRRVSLAMQTEGGTKVTAAGLDFPPDWNPVVSNSPILFSIQTPPPER